MSSENNHPKQLMMLRRAAPVPQALLREGWSVRSMRENEGAAWVQICQAAGLIGSSGPDFDQCWEKMMGSDPGVKSENVFFVCDPSGTPVATATARLIPQEERSHYPPSANALGYLHYVAATPQCRGTGAGSAATAAVLKRLEALGLGDCVLTTDDFRLPAIKIYLRMGWLPVLHDTDMRARWERVLGQLGVTGAIETVEASGETAAPLEAEPS